MTRFTVDWDTDAENELARLYTGSNDPAAVTHASARIDQRLANNPLREGQLLSEGLYRIDERPLAAHYTIDLVRRHVQVTWVRSAP